jgi:hypothetical protein
VARFGFGKRRKGEKLSGAEETVPGLSPDPMTNLVLSDVVLRTGGTVLRHAVERAMLGKAYTPAKAQKVISGRSIGQTLVGAALARVATTSVPGAIVVGGGLLAKTLYDFQKGTRRARAEGEAEIKKQAKRG